MGHYLSPHFFIWSIFVSHGYGIWFLPTLISNFLPVPSCKDSLWIIRDKNITLRGESASQIKLRIWVSKKDRCPF